jgi:hypothetical protein
MHPDLAYAINQLATYTANPSLDHYSAAKQVLRYVRGTRNLRITYHTHSTTSLGSPDSNLFHRFQTLLSRTLMKKD